MTACQTDVTAFQTAVLVKSTDVKAVATALRTPRVALIAVVTPQGFRNIAATGLTASVTI